MNEDGAIKAVPSDVDINSSKSLTSVFDWACCLQLKTTEEKFKKAGLDLKIAIGDLVT